MALSVEGTENGTESTLQSPLWASERGLVGQWLHGETTITAERALQIERVTKGEVKRQQLRPELFRGMRA